VAAIAFEHVVKRFGSFTAVDDLTLEIASSEFVVLVGPSGCGKTTALRMLAGLEAVTSGTIRIGDRVVDQLPPRQRDVAMVFQDYALYPQMSVEKNLAFGLRTRRVPRAEIDRLVRDAAERLGLSDLLGRKPRELSGGQRQRVALGRAMVRQPQAFLMDEPLSNLDAKLRVDMRAEIRTLQRETGVTTVFVTHDQVEAMTMGDRIAVMNAGVLEQVGDPDSVYNRPANAFVAGFIGSPAMTFGRYAVERGDGGLALRAGEVRLEAEECDGVGDEVMVGVRPEHVRPWSDRPDLLGPFQGVVESTEALGRETFVAVRAAGDLRFVVMLDGTGRQQPGETIRFGIERRRLYLFEPESGRAIHRRPG
jgi:ABC-type sugar transport system ATPase subunit